MSRVDDLLEQQLNTGYRYHLFTYDARGIRPGEKCELKIESWGHHLLDEYEGRRVLDIGCNLGFFAFLCAERGAQVVAIEKDLKRLTWCINFQQAVLSEYPTHKWMKNITFAAVLPPQNKKFDFIFLWSVYHHLFKQIQDHWLHFNFFRSCLSDNGILLFEGPMDPDYIIERIGLKDVWSRIDIEAELSLVFSSWYYLGDALHVKGRECIVAHR